MNTIERDLIVREAETWDLWRGWIRLNVNDRWEDGREIIPRKSICKIEVNDKRIYRLGLQKLFGTKIAVIGFAFIGSIQIGR